MRHFETKIPADNAQVGVNKKHESAINHVAGRATYIDDHIAPENCLHAYPVISKISKGRVVKKDIESLKKLKGVKTVLTAEDIPGKSDIGPVFPGDKLIADEKIEFHGQVLMLVVADSYDNARRAARKAQIETSAEEPLVDIHRAIQQKKWVRPPHKMQRGDAEKAIANAPYQLTGEFELGGQEHFYLEGQVSLVNPQEDGGMFVQCSTQHPTEIQHLVAEVLNLPFNKVTVEMRRMGGGFGGKETQAAQWACLAAVASHYTGQPVKIRLARADDFKLTGKRHPFFNQYRVGFDERGLVQGADITVTGYCGYTPDLSDAIVDRAMFHADNAYYYPAVSITGNRAFSNTVSNTAFRGFGGPQGMIVAESMMDDIARKVGQDPLEIRKLNLYQPGRDQTPYHQTVEQHIVLEMMEALETSCRYKSRREEIIEFNKTSEVIKKGLALTPVKFGISFTVQHLNQAGALVHVYTDGSIHLNHGGTEMGQGLHTKVAQIVAQVFSVDLDSVQVSATRTDKVPNTSPTAASSGADLNGMAALNAANKIRNRLIDFIHQHFGSEQDSVVFENSRVVHQKGELTFKDLVNLAYMNRVSLSANGYYATPKIHYNRETASGHPFFYFAHGVACTEVEIDCLTGESSVMRADILHDVGNSLNPAIDIGQIEGAFIQGMGWLTTEDLKWKDSGELASFNPATYKIPAIGDTPAEFNVELYDSANPETSVFRSKAVGEPPFMLAISVWCALRDAVASITDYQWAPPLDPPATSEQILKAVQQAKRWNQE